jgi:hypothetical protein
VGCGGIGVVDFLDVGPKVQHGWDGDRGVSPVPGCANGIGSGVPDYLGTMRAITRLEWLHRIDCFEVHMPDRICEIGTC